VPYKKRRQNGKDVFGEKISIKGNKIILNSDRSDLYSHLTPQNQ